MHERSLAKALIRQVEDLSREHPESRVSSIRVRIGEFSGVAADVLAPAFAELVRSSPLCGAQLHIQTVPLEAVCDECANKFQIQRFHFECENCRSRRLTLHGGEEMLLESVTLEESTDYDPRAYQTDTRGNPVSA
jgi:hydrogenase nickel incorporation protein HypA/HybF